MTIIDRIRELFGGKQSGADYGVTAGGATAATSGDEREGDSAPDSGSSWTGGESSGDGDGGGSSSSSSS